KDLMSDEVYIQSPSGIISGPIKSSVQGSKIYINDENLVIEEGGKILRPLPNGRSEAHLILQVDFHKDPFGGRLSHYEITAKKESSLVPTPSSTTININNSQGIQVGDYNTQNITGALEQLIQKLDSADMPAEQKVDVKGKL